VLKAWQQKNRYPFKFSTEASINLADHPELLTMMSEANFFAIFVGIESSDSDTLISIQKKQNARRSLEESVFKIMRLACMFWPASSSVSTPRPKQLLRTWSIALRRPASPSAW
jgi:hypothetical protein